MTKEIIDIVDESGNILGQMDRDQAEDNNHLIQNVIVFIFNSKGETWLQLRPDHKKDFKNMWDVTACGAVKTGESHEEAATRETQEETLINPKLYHVETFLNIFKNNSAETKRLSHIYVGISDDIPVPNPEVKEFRRGLPHTLRARALSQPDQHIPSLVIELDKAAAGYTALLNTIITL